jgi:hypothetical protein
MKRGFMMLETIMALVLIGLALFPLAAVISHGQNAQRGSEARLRLELKLDEWQNLLLSLPQEHVDLQPGGHARAEPPFTARWQVNLQEEGLLAVRLLLEGPGLSRACRFYKSKYIEEVTRGKRIRGN